MKRISGTVLIKESGVGVPSLEVVAYDSRDESAEAPVRDSSRANLSKVLGRRIASVTTDATGRFVINADDLSFQGNEQRPNLVVAVFAPEDIGDPGVPVPLPPEKRLLYISATPRADAGAEETYVIRLLQQQIQKFGLGASTGGGQKGVTQGNQYADSVQQTYAFRDAVRDATKGRIKAELETHLARRRKGQALFANLSAIPRYLRNDPKSGKNFLRNNQLLIPSKTLLAEKLPAAQHRSVKEGLTRLAKSDHKPKVRLQIPVSAMKRLKGKLSSKTFHDLLNAATAGGVLTKIRGLNNPSPEDLERRYLTPVVRSAPKSSNAPKTRKTSSNSKKNKRSKK